MKKVIQAIAGICASVLLFGGCAAPAATQNVDLNGITVEELAELAKKDGRVDSVGMPDSWANWGETWADLKSAYGLEHSDVDMSSAEELAVFESEKENATKDIGDVGQAFGPIAVEKGLALPYKTSYWNDIPDWAKDEDGNWIIAYYGTMAMLTNKKIVAAAPTSFADILAGDYNVSVGDVAKANQAQFAVLAAAIAFGGDEGNVRPGLDFFRQLAEQGRLDLGENSLARIEKGEIGVAFLWDYNALGYRDQFVANSPDANFEVTIPSEASIQSGYTTIINKYSKHPYAAALAREFILSDEGQINLARGYAKPVRSSVVLPDDVKAKLVEDSQYQNARLVRDMAAWEATTKEIGTLWQENVIVYTK
ncbi:MAG TPA: extracellular solute-binding protein [Feifaniaceae bacterium]|nr:extracellular solute-binding protein [Feifaniaceae bacterium]